MASKLQFIVVHYGLLALLGLAFWGWGMSVAGPLLKGAPLTNGQRRTLALVAGLGIYICALQWLGIAELLRPRWVKAVSLTGIGLAIWQVHRERAAPANGKPSPWYGVTSIPCWLVAMALATTALAPLAPTLAGDDAMYHLPHARAWADSHDLSIHQDLRYPWFPYNYDLLYSAALLLKDDVLTHMLHALAGWLTAVLVYQFGCRHANRWVAGAAALAWLWLTRFEYRNAYVDLGVSLFVAAGCISLHAWREDPRHRGALVVAAFLVGVAAGAKYQVLGLLPLFALAVLWRDRRPGTLAVATAALLLPCIFWYVRNAWLTGDPFNPLGGKIFGFSDWDLGDYTLQFEDIRSNAGWPDPILWPALAAPLFAALRQSPAMRAAMVFAAYSTMVWLVSSHYPRYLMSSYPVLALLSMAAVGQPIERIVHAAQRWIPARLGQYLAGGVVTAAVVTVANFMLTTWKQDWPRFAGTEEARDAIRRERVAGYAAFGYLRQHPARKIYQIGLEASLYHAPQPLLGDHFGRWRYRDFVPLPPKELARKLSDAGFDAVIVHTGNVRGYVEQAEFDRYFTELFVEPNVRLYRITPQP